MKQTINGVSCEVEYFNAKTDNVRVGYKVGSTVKELAQANKADVAINFNFANNTTGTPIGRLIVDGKEVNSDEPKTYVRDEFYFHDGKFIIGKAPKGADWAVQGSPRLLRDGKDVIEETIKRDQTGTDIWKNNAKRIRMAVGTINAHQAVSVRTYSEITLNALREIMRLLGCIDALNGDGGGSAYSFPADNSWGRKMGSALLINKGVNEVSEKPDLIIDPGHGGSDPGAGGNGIVEKDMNLQISLYQYERFKQLGVKVTLTRSTDIFIDSTPRATLVKNSGAKICISNHINAASAISAKGAEAIHSLSNNGAFAKAIVAELAKAGQVLRPTPTFSKANSSGGNYYYMHRLTGSVATTIVEYGFCTNAEDAARLKANWKAYAEAVVKAYCEFVGVKYVAPATETPVVPIPVDTPKTDTTIIEAKVIVNGKELAVKGEVKDGVTRVPVRAVAEALGASVAWDGKTNTVTITK